MQRKLSFNGRAMPYSEFVRGRALKPVYRTSHGALFEGDCLDVLPSIRDECVDTIFADPPFNIGKEYGKSVNDNRQEEEYLDWCRSWINECSRILMNGGAFFPLQHPEVEHHPVAVSGRSGNALP